LWHTQNVPRVPGSKRINDWSSFRRVMDLEASSDAAGFGRREGFVETRD
jgi:hypothetical protein